MKSLKKRFLFLCFAILSGCVLHSTCFGMQTPPPPPPKPTSSIEKSAHNKQKTSQEIHICQECLKTILSCPEKHSKAFNCCIKECAKISCLLCLGASCGCTCFCYLKYLGLSCLSLAQTTSYSIVTCFFCCSSCCQYG